MASNLCPYLDNSFAKEFIDDMNSSSLWYMCDISFCSCTNLLNNNTGLIEYFPDAWRIVFFLWLLTYGRVCSIISSQSILCSCPENLRDTLCTTSRVDSRSSSPRTSLIWRPKNIFTFSVLNLYLHRSSIRSSLTIYDMSTYYTYIVYLNDILIILFRPEMKTV